METSESAVGQEKRLKHKALRLLSVCRKQEKTLAAVMILYHHCFSDSVFHIACLHAKDVLTAAHVQYYRLSAMDGSGGTLAAVASSEDTPGGGASSESSVRLSSDHIVAKAAATGLPVHNPGTTASALLKQQQQPSSSRSPSPSRRRASLFSPSSPSRRSGGGGASRRHSVAGVADQLGDQIAVPVCSRQGSDFVLGVLEAVARPGKTLSPDDERLLGVLAGQLSFVVERREGAAELERLAAEGSRSVKDWQAMVADKDR